MTCSPVRPCGDREPALGFAPPGPPAPPPSLARLDRRVGDFWSLLADLIATTEREPARGGGRLGTRWDVEGDPRAMVLAELWAYVADTVTAYAELTASESYLPTARDWTDLRRIADLVGHRPRPGIAAQGWVKVDVDAGTDPVVPAGTRVQAPAAPPARPKSQQFEVAATTQLRGEWAGLTATWVPQPEAPVDEQVRFLGDPGFGVGDRVLFVLETPSPGVPVPVLKSGYGWLDFWDFLIALSFVVATPAATPRAVARVEKRTAELGTTVVRFDRDLSQLLAGAEQPYAAYRIVATAGSARRLAKVLKVPSFFSSSAPAPAALTAAGTYDTSSAITSTSVVLDAALDDLSAGQLVAVVDWAASSGTPACDVVTVKAHQPVEWEVSPGTPTRVSKLVFGSAVATLTAAAGPVTVYVLDRRVVARHYTFPDAPPAPPQLRLFPAPAPATSPERVAVRTEQGGAAVWEVLACRAALGQEAPSPPGSPAVPRGLIVDLVDGLPAGSLTRAPASANLVRVRHGATAAKTLGSGDAATANQELTAPDAPIAYDLDAAGTPVPSMVLRVEGVAWDEVPTLYTAGPADEVFSVRLGPDGGVTARFGDGDRGRRLPTGRNNVTAGYRVGGGRAGEVPGGAIDSLVGSVRGVKKVIGAGPTAGGADQDDERRMRILAPGRARAFGRVVSAEDLVDLAVGYPGVSHAAVWHGAGPPGCPCGGTGLHLVFLREADAAPRPPVADEVKSLSTYLDNRRDVTVPLCVSGGTVSVLDLTAVLAVDERRVPADVAAAAVVALAAVDGPLAPASRALGQPLDRSDVVTVLHTVPGVLGVPSLSIGGGTLPADPSLGRQPAARYELLVLPAAPDISTVKA